MIIIRNADYSRSGLYIFWCLMPRQIYQKLDYSRAVQHFQKLPIAAHMQKTMILLESLRVFNFRLKGLSLIRGWPAKAKIIAETVSVFSRIPLQKMVRRLARS